MTTKFRLSGLTCEACVKLALTRLKRLAGVQDVKINLPTGETEITSEREIKLKEAELVLAGTQYSIIKQ